MRMPFFSFIIEINLKRRDTKKERIKFLARKLLSEVNWNDSRDFDGIYIYKSENEEDEYFFSDGGRGNRFKFNGGGK